MPVRNAPLTKVKEIKHAEVIPVSDPLELRAVEEQHVTPLHQLVLKNKRWLQQSLNWPQFVESEDDTRKNVQGNMMLHQRGYAKMFLIFEQQNVVGVISFNQIEPLNKAAYIGYWLDEEHQGKGILSRRYRRLFNITRSAVRSAVLSLNAG